MTSLLFKFPFSLKTRIPEKLASSSRILYKGDMKVNPTQKGIEMFIMLKSLHFILAQSGKSIIAIACPLKSSCKEHS